MTEIVSFPWELKVLLDWDKKDMLMIIEEDKPLREILNSICEQHDKDPQEFSVKAMTSVGNVISLPQSLKISDIFNEYGAQTAGYFMIKNDKRPTSFVLENKRQEFRKADTRSLRIKEIEIKLSHSMCDLHEALTTQEQLPKFRGRRRFSEPINLATYNHIPISPLILSKSQPENPKDLFPVKKHTKKTRSFSFTDHNKPGTILKKKSANFRNLQTYDDRPPTFVESYFLCVKLPNDAYVTVQAGSKTNLEEILNNAVKRKAFLLQKNEIAAEKYTLEVIFDGEPPLAAEMDRTLGFYHNPKTLGLIIKEKKYSTMYVTEHGKDVMISKMINGKPVVMAATKEKCIEQLSDAEKTDKGLREIVLLTFRSFMTPKEFFEQLFSRYHCVPPENPTEEDMKYFIKAKKIVRENVFYVVKEWCKWYYHDFAMNEDLKNDLRDFVDEMVSDLGGVDEVIRVQCVELQKLIAHMTEHYKQVLNKIKTLNRKGKPIESMLRKLKPAQIAEQMCLWNQQLFKNISSVEFLNQLWGDPDMQEYHSPNLTFFIQRFEKESYWAATEICTVKDLNKRVATLKKIIELIKECLARNNLFSVFSLLAGLNLTPVQRLKKTWATLSNADRKLHAELEKLSDPSRNMNAYRTKSANCVPPIIPFLPIFLKDLIFFNDGNPTKLESGLINVEKLRMITEQIRSMTMKAHDPYKYTLDTEIQNYLQNPRIESLTLLIEMSNILEPKKVLKQ